MASQHTRNPASPAAARLALLAAAAWLPLAAAAAEPLPPLTEGQRHFLSAVGGTLREDGNLDLGGVIVDRRGRELRVPAAVNISKGIVEVILCTPRGRMHESLLVTWVDPFHIQLGLILLGLRNGARVASERAPAGARVEILLDWLYIPFGPSPRPASFSETLKALAASGGAPMTACGAPIEAFLWNDTDKRPMDRAGWVFVGSAFGRGNACLATLEGNICNINSRDENTILDTAAPDGNADTVFLTARDAPLPTGAWAVVRLRQEAAP